MILPFPLLLRLFRNCKLFSFNNHINIGDLSRVIFFGILVFEEEEQFLVGIVSVYDYFPIIISDSPFSCHLIIVDTYIHPRYRPCSRGGCVRDGLSNFMVIPFLQITYCDRCMRARNHNALITAVYIA